ncbi:hypothetical protein M758_2G237400 [Ceratodon purpureus]|nr:hypothetical protein M758_2G237400 [Ceratodon purpureus]
MDNPTVLYSKSTKTLVNGVDICSGAIYTAISHTWSMWDNKSKDILGIEQDSRCKGTVNFNDMLEMVKTEWVWIDTLCISESSKVTEIPNMRRYYKNAEVVLVVLDITKGDYDLRVLEVNDLEERMGSSDRFLMLNSSPERVTAECALPDEGVTIYNTLCKMFKAEWFKRGWTLQEVLLAKDVIIWNGSSSVSVTDVKKCLDWLGAILPDVVNGLEMDEDFAAMQSLFHTDSSNISFELVDELMDGRKCTKEEDYVYSILGLLDIDMKIEYGISREVCKRRLFTRLVQEQRAASLFSHTGIGVFPVHSDYGTCFVPDYPRSDHVVYSLSRNGVKFAGCSVYVYEVLGLFPAEFDKEDPMENLWAITKIMGDDLSGYKDLVRAMYSITATDDLELISTKSQWFLDMAKLSATGAAAESFDVQPNLDCIVLHSFLTIPSTPWVSYGMVHNGISVCAYIFSCLEAVPQDGQCMLLAPGIVGERNETGLLCSGPVNLRKSKQRKIGATLNLKKDNLGDIEPIANLAEVVVTNMKRRRRKQANQTNETDHIVWDICSDNLQA